MADHSMMKLGKREPKVDSRTLKLARYFTPDLPPPPPVVNWTGGVTSWGMMKNDERGNCTIAGCGHLVQTWTLPTGMVTVSDDDVMKYYGLWDGYNPADPSSDRGGVELDVLNQWRQSDFAGHKILGYADPDPGNIVHVQQSISLFGSVYIGLALPNTAKYQEVWDVVGDPANDPDSIPGSWGGHCVSVPWYDDPNQNLTCITWGQNKEMTYAFWKTYCDESHAILSLDWASDDTPAPSGFALADLKSDLASVTG